MNKKTLSLNDLEIGKTGNVVLLKSEGNERRRMLDLGLVKDTKVEALYKERTQPRLAEFIKELKYLNQEHMTNVYCCPKCKQEYEYKKDTPKERKIKKCSICRQPLEWE